MAWCINGGCFGALTVCATVGVLAVSSHCYSHCTVTLQFAHMSIRVHMSTQAGATRWTGEGWRGVSAVEDLLGDVFAFIVQFVRALFLPRSCLRDIQPYHGDDNGNDVCCVCVEMMLHVSDSMAHIGCRYVAAKMHAACVLDACCMYVAMNDACTFAVGQPFEQQWQ